MQQKRIGAKIANEILMSIRAERKQRGEVPLTDPIGVDRDGNEITLADVLSSDDDVCEKAQRHEEHALLRNAVNDALTVREKKVIIMTADGCISLKIFQANSKIFLTSFMMKRSKRLTVIL